MKKLDQRKARQIRIRKKMLGTSQMPRLAVFRSNKHIYAQLIDDEKSQTLVSSSDIKAEKKEGKVKSAYVVGENLAKAASEKKIKKIIFDRRGFKYHGRVKSLAEGARKGGLNF